MAFTTPARAPQDPKREQLHSTIAQDLLTEIAGRLGQTGFTRAMQHVFGNDITAHAFAALWNSLMQKELKAPPLILTKCLGYQADYDNRERAIRIDWDFFSAAVEQGDRNGGLLSVLLHEFGHHIDNLLRDDFSRRDCAGKPAIASDAAGEEGHRFTSWMINNGEPLHDQVLIATYMGETLEGAPHSYHLSWEHACGQIRQALDHIDDRIDGHHHHADREAFEAGSDDSHGHTHQTIAWALSDFGFKREEIDAVYFGNWLRDYSQVVDPKITRAVDMPKEFPALVSRQAWTDLVDILSVRKFPDLRMRHPSEMRVTPDKLGVYLPHEHIDNPLAIDPAFPDPTVRDPDFAPWVLPGDPLLEADGDTSMKRYLSTSVDYMQQRLRQTMGQRRSLEGLRNFGAALHVLEDLFAHSNFAELSLIMAGHAKVLPWTKSAGVKGDLPLVTGTFGGSDIIASLAAPLGKILYSTTELAFELTQPGYRSDRDKVMLILLSEHPNQSLLSAFELLLEARDGLIVLAQNAGLDTLKFYRWLINTPAGILINAYNSTAQGVLSWIGNSVGDAQIALTGDPNVDASLEPTHSQLSKDHAEHPLHDLCATLATEAVRRVTQAMLDHWEGKPDADPAAVAAQFFCHPADADWHHEIVKAWAENYPDRVERAQSKSDLDQIHQQAIKELEHIGKQLLTDSQHYITFLSSEYEQASGLLGIAEQALQKLISSTSWGKELLGLTQ